MNALGIAIAGLGAGLPDGAVSATLGIAPSPAELFAGLGVFALATLGVLVVRALNTPSDLPAAPVASPDPKGDDLERAA
jgi:hypothetical protein